MATLLRLRGTCLGTKMPIMTIKTICFLCRSTEMHTRLMTICIGVQVWQISASTRSYSSANSFQNHSSPTKTITDWFQPIQTSTANATDILLARSLESPARFFQGRLAQMAHPVKGMPTAPSCSGTSSPSARQLPSRLRKRPFFECEDARDRERLLRRKREAQQAYQDTEQADVEPDAAPASFDPTEADINLDALAEPSNRQSETTKEYISSLTRSGWIDSAGPNKSESMQDPSHDVPAFTKARRRHWQLQIQEVEAEKKQNESKPQAATGAGSEIYATTSVFEDDFGGDETETTAPQTLGPGASIPCLPTQCLTWADPEHDKMVDGMVAERGLNDAKALAFRIVAKWFFRDQQGVAQPSLKLLMHGAAGTGKTVVVRLLRELLAKFGKAKEMMSIAPTGKAASAIGGSTQHSAFALDIRRRGQTSDEFRSHQRDSINSTRMRFLQDVYRDIKWIFLDEVSMSSAETLSDIDQALRIGKDQLDVPFGGVHMMFAGDFCQLPPVCATALYRQDCSSAGRAEESTKAQLGRAVWLDVDMVVEFTEQRRMQDQKMAAALARLRLRRCTDDDAALFNANVIRGSARPGAMLSSHPGSIVLARTNETVRILNEMRATSQASIDGGQVILAHARDVTTAQLTPVQHEALLAYNGPAGARTCLGRLPLFVGMPVVFRGGNLSLTLGITNGSFATVAGFDIVKDVRGRDVARGILLEFDGLHELQLTDLPVGSFPVGPSTTTFNFSTGLTDAVARITRHQIPVSPGFAMTVHSAQGITATNGVVVDLRSGGFEAYVAASRATRASNLFLIAPVTTAQLNRGGLPIDLAKELDRLALIADRTSIAFQQSPPAGSESPTSNQTRKRSAANSDGEPLPKKRRME
ncbi:hypothetical protein V8E36_002726 [Tilletia maclaganii]